MFYNCNISHVNLLIDFLTCFVSAKFVYCGSKEPLWHCTHAFTKNVQCVYAICSSCKLHIESSLANTNKRRKRNESNGKSITKDCDDPHSQNHKIWNLEPYCDDSYLTVANFSMNVKKGQHVPQKCAKCDRIICNKKNC